MNFETMIYEETNGVGILKLNRPKALNSLNKQTIDELFQFVGSARSSHTLKCLVITGEGKAFVAGADIKEFADFSSSQALQLSQRGQNLMNEVEQLPMPVIAAVNGFALGGGLELALACDFIIASSKAKLGLPEVSLGVIPGYGGTQRLARNVGKSIARTVALSGDVFSAQDFYNWGLISKLVEPEQLMDEAMKWGTTLASRGPLAMKYTKQAINLGFDQSQMQGLELEAKLFSQVFASKDQKEGVNAFIEKRPPQFTGE